MAAVWDLPSGWSARLLSWAARLCEIGITVSHTGYHKHGAYIVAHADMAGFSRDEQAALGTVIRCHRRKLGAELFAGLSPRWVEPVTRLCLLFRLACGLHRSRVAEALPPLSAKAKKNRLRLSFPARWLAERPLSQAGLEQEAAYWRAVDYELGWGEG